jgi:hypothetical protein
MQRSLKHFFRYAKGGSLAVNRVVVSPTGASATIERPQRTPLMGKG